MLKGSAKQLPHRLSRLSLARSASAAAAAAAVRRSSAAPTRHTPSPALLAPPARSAHHAAPRAHFHHLPPPAHHHADAAVSPAALARGDAPSPVSGPVTSTQSSPLAPPASPTSATAPQPQAAPSTATAPLSTPPAAPSSSPSSSIAASHANAALGAPGSGTGGNGGGGSGGGGNSNSSGPLPSGKGAPAVYHGLPGEGDGGDVTSTLSFFGPHGPSMDASPFLMSVPRGPVSFGPTIKAPMQARAFSTSTATSALGDDVVGRQAAIDLGTGDTDSDAVLASSPSLAESGPDVTTAVRPLDLYTCAASRPKSRGHEGPGRKGKGGAGVTASATPASVWNPRMHPIPAASPATASSPSVAVRPLDCGEDALFIWDSPEFVVMGVADGVGGWADLGVDPSLFAWALMDNCKTAAAEMVSAGEQTAVASLPSPPTSPTSPAAPASPKLAPPAATTFPDPKQIMTTAYTRLVEQGRIRAGSSTATVLTFEKHTCKLHAANLGDSGFLILGDGGREVLFRSKETQHYFNAPYQLSISPPGLTGSISDSPSDATVSEHQLRPGDVIVVATDGLFDNVHLRDLMFTVQRELHVPLAAGTVPAATLAHHTERLAQALVAQARDAALNPTSKTPFGRAASRVYGRTFVGGKMDDITVLASLVVGAAPDPESGEPRFTLV
ncbi:Protein phosphatase PTC7 [Allomyces arbusculus]|nr:Protein phosphatase PTC7 [Allomyces arbusculus]